MGLFWLEKWMLRGVFFVVGKVLLLARWALSFVAALVVGIVGVFRHRGLVKRRARRLT